MGLYEPTKNQRKLKFYIKALYPPIQLILLLHTLY